MRNEFIKKLKKEREKVLLRWEAVQVDGISYDHLMKDFFNIFGSIGDCMLTSMKFNSGHLTRELAVVLLPSKEDVSVFEYSLIYVMYESTKVEGLYDYKNNYKEIKRYSEGLEDEIFNYMNEIKVREPDIVSW